MVVAETEETNVGDEKMRNNKERAMETGIVWNPVSSWASSDLYGSVWVLGNI